MRWYERVREVEMRGLEHLRAALEPDQGVILVSNHAAHSDPFVLLRASDRVGRLFYYMVSWQSFQLLHPISRWVLRWHGSFSVDREGNDLRAFRQAVAIVREERNPLMLFAEGEIYHAADRVAPFRQGAAAIALTALRQGKRPVACVPAAIRYRYIEDPTPALLPLVEAMEQKVLGHPRRDQPLAARLARLGEAGLAQRELQFLGHVQHGPFAPRAAALTETILRSLEQRYGTPPEGTDIPERVRRLRRSAIRQKETAPTGDQRGTQAVRDLDDITAAVQLFSYTDDYQSEEPTIEHLAEIVDKFEEDLLGVTTARTRGRRRAIITFGPALAAAPFQEQADGVRALTAALEEQVRGLLAQLKATDDRNGPHLVPETARSGMTAASANHSAWASGR